MLRSAWRIICGGKGPQARKAANSLGRRSNHHDNCAIMRHNEYDISTVRLLQGLGFLYFGASPDEVASYIGTPDRIEPTHEVNGVIWKYFAEEIDVGLRILETRDLRMVKLSSKNPSTTLFGVQVINAELKEITRILENNSVVLLDAGYLGDGEMMYFFSHGLTLLCDRTRIDSIMWDADQQQAVAKNQ
jgi:hypothetical protein